ncbi:hypothetical protein [Roseateles sp. PN1]|uniref:hypothetical protein n=1 Tax=Roseateles sp. PN1 TaxID=3137372 RepID=UPI0031395EC0
MNACLRQRVQALTLLDQLGSKLLECLAGRRDRAAAAGAVAQAPRRRRRTELERAHGDL